jgi:Plasmid pRiA4b ORF-3-like protein
MGMDITNPPGRLFLASPRHTLADLATAIDLAFARWDISHLHLFRIGDVDYSSYPEEPGQPDSNDTLLGDMPLGAGSEFLYVFDLGDDWTHECTVEATDVDPEEVLGGAPAQPAPFFGWGSIPDQYGRETEAQDEDDAPHDDEVNT